MEPSTTLLMCTTAFGFSILVLILVSTLMLSRNKKANDKTQRIALQEEIETLSKFREEIMNTNQFTAHYQALSDNQTQINKLNEDINEILNNKLLLANDYTKLTEEGSKRTRKNNFSKKEHEKYQSSKLKINEEIQFYEKELKWLKGRRDILLDNRDKFKDKLLEEEKKRNKAINELYQSHTTLLEKLYIQHNKNSERIGTKTIEAITDVFKFILYPLIKLVEYWIPGLFKDAEKNKSTPKKPKSTHKILNQNMAVLKRNNSAEICTLSPRFFKPVYRKQSLEDLENLDYEESLDSSTIKEQKPARLMI